MRICLASSFGIGLWYAWKMQCEGHHVTSVVSIEKEGEEHYATEPLKGLVTVSGKEIDPTDYDLIVFDDAIDGKYADEAREVVPTIGNSELAVHLEQERLFALDFMVKCGIQVPPYEAFDNPADGIRYAKKRDKRLVFKPIGKEENKSCTYVSKSAEDMVRYFDILFRSTKVSEYLLQDYVEGIECATNAFINSTGYYAISHDVEVKKFLCGNLGANTGCMGNLVWMAGKENELFRKGLKKCLGPLQEMGYVGPIDLATIVNKEGCWGLEFTPRFGYDSTQLMSRLIPDGRWADFLYAVAAEERIPEYTIAHPFCASVELSIPPYPNKLSDKIYKETAGIPIEGLTEDCLECFYAYDVRRRGESDDFETAGLCGLIGTPLAVGDNPGAAFDCAYQMLKEIQVPNGQYRTDICENTTKRYWQLKEGGYLK